MIRKKLLISLMIGVTILGLNLTKTIDTSAETAESVNIRILATGDLHGQVTSYDCETYLQTPKEGLSKILTLVKQKKREAGDDPTLFVDAGDFLNDYTSNYFYENHKDLVQPIMKSMSLMGYDFIALGNHEFDYPWDYLYDQLNSSDLLSKVVLSNVFWHDSGKTVFAPSKVKIMELTSTSGEIIPVKIGIVGSTTNSISTRRGDYVNEIDAANNYDSIVAEANRLKEIEKVDVVLVILHGGIGAKTLNKDSDNIGYALTKIEAIDALVTAHTHEAFPDSDSIYNKLSNVDSVNGTINGKPVIATTSHAQALGIIDLRLTVNPDGSVHFEQGKSYLEYVTKATIEDRDITTLFQSYLKKLPSADSMNTYKIAKGITYHNYDTILQDSNLFQLFNNAKIDYGMTYISEYLPNHKEIPVIAATRNLLDNEEAYVAIKGTISADKIARILSESSSVRSGSYIQMYEISGKNLREWLEYTASMYATQGSKLTTLLQSYFNKNKGVSTLLQDNFVYNWRSQYVFDGISYQIDLTKKARYSSDGVLISSKNKRITYLNFNGSAVTDTQKFVFVTDSGLPTLSFLPKEGEDSIKEIRDYATGKSITLDYIKKISAYGDINVKPDYNWSLTAGKNYSFILGVPKTIVSAFTKYPWNAGLAAETTSYAFLKGKLPTVTQALRIWATQGRTDINNTPVPVVIHAVSSTSIKEMKYIKGKITKTTDAKWNSASVVKNNRFTTAINGVYSIRVKDGKGNYSIAYVTVDRYDAKVLPSPMLDRLTNRNTEITGIAVPGATIYVTIDENQYQTVVSGDGSFRIIIPPQKAFATITAYIKISDKLSATVTAAVRKTGPDAVSLNKVTIGDTHLRGIADKNTFVYAMIWNTVYVPKGQINAYIQSDFYNASYKIVETEVTIDEATGIFDLTVPFIRPNMKAFVYSVDRFGATSKPAIHQP
ncbi:MAG: hypothetical protein K0S76_1969 [Herbinix sp.]|jgi:2',3'-cyclic-nucleotide 2'-phosphodiesterase/3'-nucleotidase|nr:hypothetical protein [Herbinix sp.]